MNIDDAKGAIPDREFHRAIEEHQKEMRPHEKAAVFCVTRAELDEVHRNERRARRFLELLAAFRKCNRNRRAWRGIARRNQLAVRRLKDQIAYAREQIRDLTTGPPVNPEANGWREAITSEMLKPSREL